MLLHITSLHCAVNSAAKRGHALMVRLLKGTGADLTLMDASGRPAAYYCSQNAALRAELSDPALPYLMALAGEARHAASHSAFCLVRSTCQ